MPPRNVIPHWLPVHPEAIIARQPRGWWFPLIHLVWLFWMAGAPWFFDTVQWRMVALTYLSLPVFLWLYFQCWYGDRRNLMRHTVAIAVLGFGMIVLNSSCSYVIYAAVVLPYCTRGRRLLLCLAVLALLLFAVEVAVGFPPLMALGFVISCIALACINLLVRINQERDAELRLSHEEVRRLAAAAERERISRDLHDLLGHTLSMVALKSELAGKLIGRDDAAARREIEEVQRVARDNLAEVRSAVTGLRATDFAAELVSARLLLESSGVQTTVEATDTSLPETLGSALALLLREAVTNIHRHARASRAQIRLDLRQGRAELRVQDDGCGGIGRQGNGLSGLASRSALLGGTLRITSPKGGGTTLEISLPLPVGAPMAAAA